MCANEMMMSNLGVLPIETNFGDLILEGFWGPSVLVGIEGEQMIGAATLHGAIHLLHSSYAPLFRRCFRQPSALCAKHSNSDSAGETPPFA
jgi:hypothetical protein